MNTTNLGRAARPGTRRNMRTPSMTWGGLPRLAPITHTVDETNVSGFTYDYDAMGRITQWGQTQNGATNHWTMEMDAVGQLRAVLGATEGM